MKLEIASVLAFLCCSLIVSTSAKLACAQHDEWNIPAFRCRSGDECVSERYECDSFLDCADYSDEDHCEERHRSNCIDDFKGKVLRNGEALQKFTCKDRMCILGCQRCDGTQDCRDGSDEEFCTENEVRPPC